MPGLRVCEESDAAFPPLDVDASQPSSRAGTPASLDDFSPTARGATRMQRNSSIESLEFEAESTQQPMVWKVVLTGGPCGGKTTALSIIADKLRSLGLQVFTVPENATLFSNAGAGFPVHSHKEHQLTWETSRMICQMQMEDSFENIAKASHRPTVILCDRGVVDACAYMDSETWHQVLCSMGWSEKKLRDDRYHMILHMVSTAVGAESCYVNTVYRHETPKQAAELDVKIQRAWRRHRKRCEVDNSTGYDEKVRRVVDMLCSGIGIVSGTSRSSRTYQLRKDFVEQEGGTFPQYTENMTTIIVFLKNATSKSYSFLRLRKHHGSCISFAQGSKTPGCYKERHISQGEFLQNLPLAMPQWCISFQKKVWMVQTKNHDTFYYEVSVHDSFCTLKVETTSTSPIEKEHIEAWIVPYIVADITDDPQWELFELAQRAVKAEQERQPKQDAPEEGAQPAGSLGAQQDQGDAEQSERQQQKARGGVAAEGGA